MPVQRAPEQASPAPPTSTVEPTRRFFLGGLLLAALILAAYHNSFNGHFIFDDQESIPQNTSIRHFDTAFFPPDGNGVTVSGRPVLNASFALNYAISGGDRIGFQVGNVLIHLFAALTLWAVARRTLRAPLFTGEVSQQAMLLAWFTSALWAVHPLQTESVTYTVQRAESLVGLFYLLTLYGFIRYAAGRSWHWFLFTGSACLLGMGSKEVMATAPLVVFLYDRTFVSGSFRAAWQRHCKLHLCLVSTLALLAVLVVAGRGRGGSVGVNETVTWWSYICTQAVAIVRYVWLTIWPARLTFDYGVLVEKDYAVIIPCALAVLGALIATTVATIRWPQIGFIGLWFFAILAPSSSVIPVVTQTVAEHRMYLSLAALTAATVLLANRGLGKRYWIFLFLLIIAEGAVTIHRNALYQNEVAIWEDTAAKQPNNYRAWNNLGVYRLHKEKNFKEAMRDFERSLQIFPEYPEAINNLGRTLVKLGRQEEGLALVEKSLQLAPSMPTLHAGYGSALMDCNEYAQALPHLEKALAGTPDDPSAHYNLANALMNLNRETEAESHYLFVLGENPDDIDALNNYGTSLRHLGRVDEAIVQFKRVLKIDPASPKAHNNLGVSLMMQGKNIEGLQHLRESVRLDPTPYEPRSNLARALAQTGHAEEAIVECEKLVQEKPDTELYNNLGTLYGQLGQLDKAGKAFRAALQLDPANPAARDNYAKLRAYLDNSAVR
jgi:tetratricopeptide (TPR) repeat protein